MLKKDILTARRITRHLSAAHPAIDGYRLRVSASSTGIRMEVQHAKKFLSIGDDGQRNDFHIVQDFTSAIENMRAHS